MRGREHPVVERVAELDAVGSVIDAARSGSGRVGLVSGVAGIGKTTLLEAGMRIAADGGAEVLSARGSALERPIPYGVVRQLVERRVLGEGEQRASELLAGPAAPAAYALGRPQPGPAQPTVDLEFEIFNGLHWLCSRLAESGPLLLVIDDVQWADDRSQRAGAYLARRLADQPISMLIGLRTGESTQLELELADLPATPITPAALSAEGASRIVTEAFGGEAPPAELVEACLRATGGNPFFLVELAFDLAQAHESPAHVPVGSVGDAGPPAVRRSMLMRLGRLGPEAAALARALATLGGEADLQLAREVAGLEQAAAATALDRLAAAEIVVAGPVPRIAHPLIRAAVLEETPASELAAAHRRAFAARAAAGHPRDRLLPHALECTPIGDPALVEVLTGAAAEDLALGMPADAVRCLERALAEPPTAGGRRAVVAALGRARVRAGDFARGLEALEEVAKGAPADDPLAATVVGERAFAIAATRGMEDAREVVSAAVERARAVGGDEHLAMQAELAQLAWLSGVPHGLDLDRYREVEGTTPAERTILGILAQQEQARGVDADLAAEYASRALAGGRLIAEEGPEAFSWYLAVYTLLTCESLDLAEQSIADAGVEAERRGSAFATAGVLGARAVLALNRGRPADAERAARAADGAAMPPAMAPVNTSFLALALVDQGQSEEARAALEAGGIAAGPGGPTVLRFVPWAQARLAEAERDLPRLREAVAPIAEDERSGMPMRALAWRALLARALARAGDGEGELDEAQSLAREHLRWAQRWGRPGALGVAQRSHALACEGGERAELLEAAVASLELAGARVEEARARLDLGLALSRLGRREEGAAALEAAFEVASGCGARDVAKLAAAEIEVGGGARMRLRFDELTPAERRVAEMAAAGSTNRVIAEQLFLSPKTVENHLTRVYAKLGITSREELGAAL